MLTKVNRRDNWDIKVDDFVLCVLNPYTLETDIGQVKKIYDIGSTYTIDVQCKNSMHKHTRLLLHDIVAPAEDWSWFRRFYKWLFGG